MPEESLDLDSYPVSIPASPGSLASVHGHALSHVTFSPGRQAFCPSEAPVCMHVSKRRLPMLH